LTTLKCFQEKEVFKEVRSRDKDDSSLAIAKQDSNRPSEEEKEKKEKQ
jgi:hypothetical protein